MPHIYYADIRVDGILWHHSLANPTKEYFINQTSPVLHNYGLTLALAGYIVDPDIGFASLFGITKYKKPIELFKKYGIYAYPPMIKQVIASEILMSAINEGLVMIKKKSRLAYPVLTKVNVMMPGTTLYTVVISKNPLPNKIVTRIGTKRNGVLRINLRPVHAKKIEEFNVLHPFNVDDTVKVTGYIRLLRHEAGDIAIYGVALDGYEIVIDKRTKITVPSLRGM